MKKIPRHRAVKRAKPEIVLARALEAMLIEAGMPHPPTKAQFREWHDRLYGDKDYREGHKELMRQLKIVRDRKAQQ